MWPQGNANAVKHIVAFLDAARLNRYAGIIIGVMGHAERIGLRLPAIRVKPARMRPGRIVEDLVDRHHLARLRLGNELVIVIAPPRRHAGAEYPPGIFRALARTRHDVANTHLKYVAGLGIPDGDRPGADVHPEPF